MVCVAPLPSNQKSKIASRKSDGTPRYGLVHLLLHLGSAKNPMFIGLVTVVHLYTPLGIPHAFSYRQVVVPAAKPRSDIQSIRTYPNLFETIRTRPNLSEVKYFFSPFIGRSAYVHLNRPVQPSGTTRTKSNQYFFLTRRFACWCRV
jgi:hypothetical protein